MHTVDDFASLDLSKLYSYRDYLTWTFSERVELIRGKILKMSPAPRRIHQEVLGNLYIQTGSLLQGSKCKVFIAPFDVRLPKGDLTDDQTYTVVQPDMCVVCDRNKLDDKGCVGAPDLIIEVISPSSTSRDTQTKFKLYEESGVNEYWMVFTSDKYVQVFYLDKGKYVLDRFYTMADTLQAKTIEGLNINLSKVFEEDEV